MWGKVGRGKNVYETALFSTAKMKTKQMLVDNKTK